MEIDPYDPASVQYDDWKGSLAGDERDMRDWEELLGIDKDRWRLIYLKIYISGGIQWIEPYAVSADTSYGDLEALVNSGRPIQLTHLDGIEYHHPDHSDFNPPIPEQLPIQSATDFLRFAFKRFEMKFTYRHIPEGATFEEVDVAETEVFE